MIKSDPKSVVPPDDSGSDTFARFKYQAHAIFPLCLFAVTTSDIRSVIPEHLEDIAVEGIGSWRFVQIKTRNPESGPWTLASVLPPSGALQSLWRAYRVVGSGVEATYEMLLEGSLKASDDIQLLGSASDRPKLAEALAGRLEVTKEEAAAFLQRVRVMVAPHRAGIIDRNLRLLAAEAPQRNGTDVQAGYTRVIAAIEEAMVADRLADLWPRVLLDPDLDRNAGRLSRKMLTRSHLADLLRPLLGDRTVTVADTAAAGLAAGCDSAVVRELIAEALSDDELNDLCHDHYPEVYRQYSSGMTGRRKIGLLIEHCARRRCLSQLAERVGEVNGAKYEEFAPRLQSIA